MAEVLATMVVGPLVSMVKEKASSYLLDQYKVMEGMEEQHKLLKRKLPAVLDVITDAEEQAAKNREGAKAWLEELRTVAYKANDVLDEFKYEALRRKAKAEGHYKEFGMNVIKLFPSHNRFVFRYRMANKLRMILQEIDVLIAEMNNFRFKFKPQPPMSLKWRQTDPNIPDYSVNIASESRAKEKKEIVDALLGQGDNVGLTVLPVVGMGGMGKTTLAQLVYNDSIIQKHFQICLWVCVSENFDVDSLAERIVEAANKANGSQATGTTPLDKLQNAVSGKRYLLVLDDVWNRETYKWEKLKSYLHHGGTGSSVVTTTRDKDIAQFMGTVEAHKIMDLELSSIKKIIETRAFSPQAQRPDLKKMIGDVAKRCSGSPLAATALGSVLRTKNTVQEWESVLNRSTICDEENGILPVLKLSYNCLPPHMRQCFAFCAMFPKDHEIDVEMLIRLWMANNFIPEQKGVCPEVIGKQIFNELAQRSFFQEVKQVKSNVFYPEEHRYCVRTTCKIHDLMHDVAQDSMGEECVTICTKLSQSEDFPYTARHLFMSVDIPEKVLNPSPDPAIQTLICEKSTKDDLQHLLPECRSVRALKTRLGSSPSRPSFDAGLQKMFLVRDASDLDLVPGAGSARQKCGICFIRHKFGEEQRRREIETVAIHLAQPQLQDGVGRRVPNRPSFLDTKYLHHLRYLDLSGSYMKEVPEEITILYHLQTLNLSDCRHLEQLPKAMKYMTALRHLYTHGCPELKSMPPDLGYLTSLQTLTCFVAGIDSDCSNIRELEKLDLGGQLKLSHLGNVTGGGGDAKAAKLEDKRKLEELELSWEWPTTDGDMEAQEMVLEGLKPHDGIKAMRVHRYMGRALPTWIMKLQGMVELSLRDCTDLKMLPALWELPELRYLYLDGLTNLHCLFSGGPPSKFQKLEIIVLEYMPEFVTWWDKNEVQGEVIFPKVEYMKISGCKRLEALPAFPALRKMELSGLTEFQRWGTVEGEQATFPSLEELEISHCPKVIAFPEAGKLSKLHLYYCNQHAPLQAASRYISSLSSMKVVIRFDAENTRKEVQVCGKESPMEVLDLCGSVFFSHSRALELWKCFGKLACLKIEECNDLKSWPENLFRGLVSLRTLEIKWCSMLTGLTEQACDEQSTSEPSLPCLESLEIVDCKSLEQVPNLWASPLKTLNIKDGSDRLRSIVFGQQEDCKRLLSGDGSAQPADTSSSLIVPVSSSADNHYCFFPRLESLTIHRCSGLSGISNLPRSVKTLDISLCDSLVSLSGEVSSLEEISIVLCNRLQSLPNGPYSSLRDLKIQHCESLEIWGSDGLDRAADIAPSIKTLMIDNCGNLVSLPGEFPSLEKLIIRSCNRLQSLPNGPYSSLKVLQIWSCESIIKQLQECLDHLDDKELDSSRPQEQVDIDSKSESLSDGASTSSVVLKQSSPTSSNHFVVFPCLEDLEIWGCHGLTEVANLPSSIKTLNISSCGCLVSLPGKVSSLEELEISNCPCLESLPNGPAHQAYSSLRVLTIKRCSGIKQLPPSLQQRLDHLEKKDLDPHLLQGRIAALMRKLECFRSRSQD